MVDEAQEIPRLKDPLAEKWRNFFSKRVTRRDFLSGGVGLALATAVGLPAFLKQGEELRATRAEAENAKGVTVIKIVEDEQSKRAALVAELESNNNKTKELQRKSLEKLTSNYAEEFDFLTKTGNEQVRSVFGKREVQHQEKEQLKQLSERVRLVLERGVFLAGAWDNLDGSKPSFEFDRDGRLLVEGTKLRVNENLQDFHLALNLLRTGLGSSVEKDPEEASLLKEDYEDLRKLVEIHPQIEIDEKCWAIMPIEWASAVARYFAFVQGAGLPLPQKTVIVPETIDSSGSRSIAGYYEGRLGRFPQRSQVLNLGSHNSSDIVFHEGGHYVADVAFSKRRLIGLETGRNLPNHQAQFDKTMADVLRGYYKSAIKNKEKPAEINWFVTDYASTNPREDFAETFEWFFYRGPLFRLKIAHMRKLDSPSAGILEAKYEYMRTVVGAGKEYSYGGRRRREEIVGWEEEKTAKVKFRDLLSTALVDGEKFYTGQLKQKDFAKDAEVKVIVPGGNPVYSLALMEPLVVSNLCGTTLDEVESISPPYTLPHLELRGKFAVRVPTGSEANVFKIDTNTPGTVEGLVSVLPSLKQGLVRDITREGGYDTEAEEYLKREGLADLRVNAWVWESSYPPSFIDRPDLFFVRFSKKGEGMPWTVEPIDVRKVSFNYRVVTEYRDQRENFYPLVLADKDVILAMDASGELVRLFANGIASVH